MLFGRGLVISSVSDMVWYAMLYPSHPVPSHPSPTRPSRSPPHLSQTFQAQKKYERRIRIRYPSKTPSVALPPTSPVPLPMSQQPQQNTTRPLETATPITDTPPSGPATSAVQAQSASFLPDSGTEYKSSGAGRDRRWDSACADAALGAVGTVAGPVGDGSGGGLYCGRRRRRSWRRRRSRRGGLGRRSVGSGEGGVSMWDGGRGSSRTRSRM